MFKIGILKNLVNNKNINILDVGMYKYYTFTYRGTYTKNVDIMNIF